MDNTAGNPLHPNPTRGSLGPDTLVIMLSGKDKKFSVLYG
ncbi:MAG: hypothetical protein MjAS7_0393 [Metallosphaera javensis (ex Sakai et al. 2022)]|nr:MAG: hypothetical protein MjAS7_0393 [Metallosphaera javensis (ex Sakai et al. 2022)]